MEWKLGSGGIAMIGVSFGFNIWLLRDTQPFARATGPTSRTSPRSFLRTGTRALYLTALSYGAVGAVYWTFAVAAISQASSRATFAASMFWTLIGIAGVLGIWSGWVIARLGLRRSHTLLLGGLAAATALIAAAPGWWPAVGVSAIIYGPVFMATSGLLAVWSYHVFPDRPAAGLNATVLFLGLGAVIGPALFGALADLWNLRPALLLVAAIAVATVGARPRTTTAHAAR